LPDPVIISAGTITLEKKSALELIYNFIEHSFDYWPKIKNRDKSFFINSADKIFGGFESLKDKIQGFTLIFTIEGILNEENQSIIARKFRQMVRQSINYAIEKLGNGKSITFGKVKFTKEQLQKLKAEWDPTKEEDELESKKFEKSKPDPEIKKIKVEDNSDVDTLTNGLQKLKVDPNSKK